MATARCGTL